MRFLVIISIITFLDTACITNLNENPCSRSNTTTIAQWPNAVIYEIFIQSFADSNGDGIGNIIGMTSKLNYFQDC